MAQGDLLRRLDGYRPDLLLCLACFCGGAVWLIWFHTVHSAPPAGLAIGIATAGLLLGGIRRWPAVALGMVGAFVFLEPSQQLANGLVATTALTLGGVTTAFIIQRAGVERSDILDPRALLWVLAAAAAGALAATALGVVAAVAADLMRLSILGPVSFQPEMLLHRLTRYGIGLLLVAPVIMVWATPAKVRWNARSWAGFAATIAGSVAISCWTYLRADTGPIAWLPYPVLIAAALGFHLRGAVTSVALSSLIVLLGTTMGRGPFALAAEADRILLAQGFVAITCATMMLLAAYADKRGVEERRLLAEQRYRAIFEQAGVGVSIHALDGRYLDVNERGVAISGYSREELVGTDFQTLLADTDADPDRVRRAIAELLDTGTPFRSRDVNLRTKSGELRPANITANIVRRPDGTPDQVIAVVQDISERVRAERALIDSEKRLRLAQEAAGVGVWEIDLVRGGSRQSPESARMFGLAWRPEPYRMADFADVLGPIQIAALRDAIGAASKGKGGLELTFRLFLPKGEGRWVRLHGRYDPNDGKPRLLGLAVDVTRDIEAQAQLREAHEKLLRVERLSAMGAMASTLAHELNQPLAAVTNYVETCRYLTRMHHDSDPVLLDALTRARDQTLRAADIIRKIRAFTITGEVTRNPIDLNALITSACAGLQRLRLGEGIEIVCRLNVLPVPLLGDPLQLEQVIGNLARNAVEATQGCPRRRVEISTVARHRDVLVEVSDTGTGLSEEMLANLFEPFRTSKENGTGLGLPICRTIIEAHGGQLWAENSPEGAIFRFTIPIAGQGEAAAA